MLPDLRLLIPATVATFFLSAALGLFTSMQIVQESPPARAGSYAAAADTPIARISASWPMPDSGREEALRELAKVSAAAPVLKAVPADNVTAPVAVEKAPLTQEAIQEAPKPSEPVREAMREPEPTQAIAAEPTRTPEMPASDPGPGIPLPVQRETDESLSVASRPDTDDPELEKEEAAPAEVVKRKPQKQRAARKRPRIARDDNPFSGLRPPGFELPNTFSAYGRHSLPR
jgi:hypothetical protein